MLPGWAIAVTRPHLEARAVANVIKLGFKVFYPKLVRRVKYHGKRIRIMCPLFPGYFFAWIEDRWTELLGAQGILGLLMVDSQLATVRKDAMQQLRARCDRNGIYIVPPRKRFTLGQQVRPQFGLFTGHIGTYEGNNGQREIALFDLLGAHRRVLFEEGVLIAST